MTGTASKLAGALSWASQAMFRRIGRAMLRPLYRHKSRYGTISWQLRLCLRWWSEVLQMQLCERRPWNHNDLSVVQLFVDARGTPAHLGAVAVIDDRAYFADWAPTDQILSMFQTRNDSQIMGLELLAIAFGLSTFKEQCRGRCVRLWSDNVGAESSTRKGGAKEFDHGSLVHAIWLFTARHSIDLRVDRVPTEDNLSDLPSREEYELMKLAGIERVQPKLDSEFQNPCAWESLRLYGRLHYVSLLRRLLFVHYVTALSLTRRQNESATNCPPLGQDELGLIF